MAIKVDFDTKLIARKFKIEFLSVYKGDVKKKIIVIMHCQSEVQDSKAGYEGQVNQSAIS